MALPSGLPQVSEITTVKEYLAGTNLIINGDMRIAQRGTSFAAIADGTYSLDRWRYKKSGAMVHTISQDTDVPTFAEAGYLFQNSLRLNLTTPDDSIAASDYCNLSQQVEGYNFAKIAQKPFTVSFWVKASTIGVRAFRLTNSLSDRSIVKTYTINSTNTWEKKTLSFPASPSVGSWNYTNGVGVYFQFILVAGTSFQTATLDEWIVGDYMSTSTAGNGVATGSTDFRITGVMLNEGIEALPFSTAGGNYESELALCKRYYQVLNFGDTTIFGRYNTGGSFSSSAITFSTMRVIPTGTYYSSRVSGRYWVDPGIAPFSTDTANPLLILAINDNSFILNQTRIAGGSTPTPGYVYFWEPHFSIYLNAEL